LEAPDSTTLTEKTPRRINPEQVPLAFWWCTRREGQTVLATLATCAAAEPSSDPSWKILSHIPHMLHHVRGFGQRDERLATRN
jgi:hypothetical protein